MKKEMNIMNASNLIDFDPNITGIVVSFFAVAGKYAMIVGRLYFLLKMVVRTSTGKERLL